MNRRFQPRMVAVIGVCLFAGACKSLEFQNVEVVDQGLEEATQSYRLDLQFELLDGDGLPVQQDDDPTFQVFEDGVPSTSESIRVLQQERIYRPVVLLLDTSESMGAGLPKLLESAAEFIETLGHRGFVNVEIYQFARTVNKAEDIASVEASYLIRPDERWTSLYYAVREVVQWHPGSVFVVFSDGADNYSQNFGVTGLDEITDMIEVGGLQVHTIGCGSVRNEMDRNGVNGNHALREIARNGTYQYVETVDGLDSVFDYISGRLQNIYSLEYHSPNLSGVHELVIRAEKGRQGGESEPLLFRVDGE